MNPEIIPLVLAGVVCAVIVFVAWDSGLIRWGRKGFPDYNDAPKTPNPSGKPVPFITQAIANSLLDAHDWDQQVVISHMSGYALPLPPVLEAAAQHDAELLSRPIEECRRAIIGEVGERRRLMADGSGLIELLRKDEILAEWGLPKPEALHPDFQYGFTDRPDRGWPRDTGTKP